MQGARASIVGLNSTFNDKQHCIQKSKTMASGEVTGKYKCADVVACTCGGRKKQYIV